MTGGTPTGDLREQLVRLRQDHGISQAELAQRIGVTQTAVSYWESGQRQPGLDDVESWAASLGASPTLLQGSPTAGSNGLGEQFRAALDADPHFGTGETVATVMRVLGEHHGDLRGQLRDAIRDAAHECGPDCLDRDDECTHTPQPAILVSLVLVDDTVEVEGSPEAFAGAALPVVEAALAKQTRRDEQEFHKRLNKALHDADWGGPDRGDVIADIRGAFELPGGTHDR